MQATVLALDSFDDAPYLAGEEEQLVLEWCIKDRSFFAFARRKQKRQARKGEREYFHQLPDPKKDLYLRLRMGQQAVVLGLVPKAGEDVQRALCKLGRRTYHITYALRHEADVEASDNSAQQQQAHSSTDTKQFSPTSSLRPVSRSSSSTKQSSGSWLQNLMSPNKRNKREHNEDEHPAKKRALTAWFMRLSKPRASDRSQDAPKSSSVHKQQQVDVHANATASNAAAAGNRLTSHPLPGLASATSMAGSRLSSNASNALDSGAQAAEQAKDQAFLQSFPSPQPQPQLPPALVASAKSGGEIPPPAAVPMRPSSVPMTQAAFAKNALGRPSTDRSAFNPLYDTTTSSPCTSNASPRPASCADTYTQAPPRRVNLHVHSLSDVPLPPSQGSAATLAAEDPLPMQPFGAEDVQGGPGNLSMQGSEGTPTLTLPPVSREQLQDRTQQQQQQLQQQGRDGRGGSTAEAKLQIVGPELQQPPQQAPQQPQQQEKLESPTVRLQTTPPSPPPPLSSVLIADAKQACRLLDQVGPTLPAGKYKEYQQLLHSLILRPDSTEEGIARALLNSVLQEITPYDKGSPVPGLPGRFTKVITLKHEQPQPQPQLHAQPHAQPQQSAPAGDCPPHSSPLLQYPQAPQQPTQQQPGPPIHRRSQSHQELSDLQQQQSQSQLQLQLQLQNQSELQHRQQSAPPQDGQASRHRRTTSLNFMQRLQKQLSEATRVADTRKTVPVKEKQAQETLMLTLQYADADQVSVGAPTSCTCIAVATAAWYEQAGPMARMSPAQYNQLIRSGANAWFQLCQDEEAQSRLLDFASVFEHLRKQPNWQCHHEVLEAYCQISAGGCKDPSTTFAQFAEGCMRQPGAYVLTVANHCTVVATRQDGTVEWANSLGRCLEPGCKMGHIAEFGSLEAFCAAYVAAHRPIQGVAQVEAHRIGQQALKGGHRFEMYSS